MRFFGTVWRVLVGIKDGLVLLFMLLFFALLYAALTAKPYAGSVREGALLLDLSGAIVEQPAERDLMDVLTGSPLGREHRLRDLVHGLDRAATDDRIKAVALDLDGFGGGRACWGRDHLAHALAIENGGCPVSANEDGDAAADDQSFRVIDANAVAADQLNEVGLEWRTLLKCPDRGLEVFGRHSDTLRYSRPRHEKGRNAESPSVQVDPELLTDSPKEPRSEGTKVQSHNR